MKNVDDEEVVQERHIPSSYYLAGVARITFECDFNVFNSVLNNARKKNVIFSFLSSFFAIFVYLYGFKCILIRALHIT
jgi:hypothetical protein